jgi:hypothetical protein
MLNLSSQQQHILRWILRQTRQAEQSQPELLETGFSWVILVNDKAAENSLRASYCRSLARLDKRGLITRIKGRKKARTSRVQLTSEGRRVAEALMA